MRRLIDKILEWSLITLMMVMLVNVLWQVLSRYLFQIPSSLTDEISTFALIWVGLIGSAYATGKGLHLAIDIVPNMLSQHKKYKLDIFINIMLIFFSTSVMVVGGARLSWLTFILEQRSAALEIYLGYIYAVLPFSGLLITYYCIDNIREKILTKTVGRHELH